MNIDNIVSQLQSRIDRRGNEIVGEYEVRLKQKRRWLYPADEEDFRLNLRYIREQQSLDKRLLGALIHLRREENSTWNAYLNNFTKTASIAHFKQMNNIDVGVDFL